MGFSADEIAKTFLPAIGSPKLGDVQSQKVITVFSSFQKYLVFS